MPQNLFLNGGARARVDGGIRPIDARLGIGLAARKGISKPGISSPEAQMRTLLATAAKELRRKRPSAASFALGDGAQRPNLIKRNRLTRPPASAA